MTLTGDTAAGGKVQAPGPRRCSTTALPRGGAITPALVRASVICGFEKDYRGGADSLYLIGRVQVQMGAGRPYKHVCDSLADIDPHKRVFDIRGFSVRYQCEVPGASVRGKARQCSRTIEAHDEGKCHQTTVCDWRCTWGGFSAPMSTDTRLRVPAPPMAEVE